MEEMQQNQAIPEQPQQPPKKSKALGIIIAVIVAAFLLFSFTQNSWPFGKQIILTVTDSGPAATPTVTPRATPTPTLVPWISCSNEELGYTLDIPPLWRVWQGDGNESSCEENLSNPFFSADILAENASYVNLEVTTKDILDETVYAGVTSADELFEKNPDLLSEGRKIESEITLGGEKAVIRSDNHIFIVHNGDLFEFTIVEVSEDILSRFFSSLEFTK